MTRASRLHRSGRLLLLAALLCGVPAAAQAFSFSDITVTTGAGGGSFGPETVSGGILFFNSPQFAIDSTGTNLKSSTLTATITADSGTLGVVSIREVISASFGTGAAGMVTVSGFFSLTPTGTTTTVSENFGTTLNGSGSVQVGASIDLSSFGATSATLQVNNILSAVGSGVITADKDSVTIPEPRPALLVGLTLLLAVAWLRRDALPRRVRS